MKTGIVYFVSYAHEEGFGCVELTLDGPIQDINMVSGVAQNIEQELSLQNVIVLNFFPLREVAEGEEEEKNL